MNPRIKKLWDQAAKTHSGDSWEEMTAFMEQFAKLVATDCIATIRLHMPRNGVNSIENTESKKHINNIADLYGIALPLDQSAYDSIMAGADIMSGDGGYREVSLKTPEFLEIQARHHALYSDVVSDGGMDPRNENDARS